DSLGPVLPRFVQWCGAAVAGEAHLRDTVDGFDRLLREATDVDTIVVTGRPAAGPPTSCGRRWPAPARRSSSIGSGASRAVPR
ncbi:hypothetical protein GQ85_40985, partial [Rhodococcus rhodochrous]